MGVTWEITIGQIISSALTLIAFMATAMGFFYALRNTIATQAADLVSFTQLIQVQMKGFSDLTGQRLETLGGRMINVEADLKEVGRCMTLVAAQDQRLAAMDERHNTIEQRFDRMEKEQGNWRDWVRGRIDELSQHKQDKDGRG